MSVDSLRRVILQLRETHNVSASYGFYTLKAVRKAIMQECGTDERTIKGNIKKLIELGYLKRYKRYRFNDTGVVY